MVQKSADPNGPAECPVPALVSIFTTSARSKFAFSAKSSIETGSIRKFYPNPGTPAPRCPSAHEPLPDFSPDRPRVRPALQLPPPVWSLFDRPLAIPVAVGQSAYSIPTPLGSRARHGH